MFALTVKLLDRSFDFGISEHERSSSQTSNDTRSPDKQIHIEAGPEKRRGVKADKIALCNKMEKKT